MAIQKVGEGVLISMIALLLAVKFAEVMIPLAFIALDNFTTNTVIAQNSLVSLFDIDGVAGILIMAGLFLALIVLMGFGIFGKKGR